MTSQWPNYAIFAIRNRNSTAEISMKRNRSTAERGFVTLFGNGLATIHQIVQIVSPQAQMTIVAFAWIV